MFLTSVPLHYAHQGKEMRWRGGMGCEDGSMPKAGPSVGRIVVTSGLWGYR